MVALNVLMFRAETENSPLMDFFASTKYPTLPPPKIYTVKHHV